MRETVNIGLVAGRHPLPVDDFIFQDGDITFPIDPKKLGKIVAEKFNNLGVKPNTGAFNVFCHWVDSSNHSSD